VNAGIGEGAPCELPIFWRRSRQRPFGFGRIQQATSIPDGSILANVEGFDRARTPGIKAEKRA
jgi:hypothetical protein